MTKIAQLKHILTMLETVQADDTAVLDEIDCLNTKALMLKFSDTFDDESYPFKGEAYDLNLIEFAFNWLQEQGHLTSSEKPTHSIPEGYAIVPVEPTEKMLIDAGTMQGYDTDDMDSSDEEHHIAWWKIMCEAAKGEVE